MLYAGEFNFSSSITYNSIMIKCCLHKIDSNRLCYHGKQNEWDIRWFTLWWYFDCMKTLMFCSLLTLMTLGLLLYLCIVALQIFAIVMPARYKTYNHNGLFMLKNKQTNHKFAMTKLLLWKYFFFQIMKIHRHFQFCLFHTFTRRDKD